MGTDVLISCEFRYPIYMVKVDIFMWVSCMEICIRSWFGGILGVISGLPFHQEINGIASYQGVYITPTSHN